MEKVMGGEVDELRARQGKRVITSLSKTIAAQNERIARLEEILELHLGADNIDRMLERGE